MGSFAPGSSRARGQWFEDRAAEFLSARGLEIVERNVDIGGAELDIVAREQDGTVVFVEVRSREHDRRGRPEETVDARKRGQLRRAATAWLVARDQWEKVPVRFDVIGIVGSPNERTPEISWIAGAFDSDD